jgi:7-cyano-7-deazaguanine synthase
VADRSKAIVLLSGGMDSCVCAALANRDHQAAVLHVSYGQRTEERERRAFLAICDRLGIQQRLLVRNDALAAIGGSALTDLAIAVPENKAEPDARFHETAGNAIPITYVPFRNAHFLSVAVSWAEVVGARYIYVGAVEQDSSGYPDCRPAYYKAFNELIRQGTKEGGIEVVTPLISMRKSQIVRLGIELNAPLDLTWSCYQGQEQACGVCDSCRLRLQAFADTKTRDPIPYVATTVMP